jgi:hypothetical protein
MNTTNLYEGRNNGLSRLDRTYYRGQAYVHWTITIRDRKTHFSGEMVHFDHLPKRNQNYRSHARQSVGELPVVTRCPPRSGERGYTSKYRQLP